MSLRAQLQSAAQAKLSALSDEALLAFVLNGEAKRSVGRPPGSVKTPPFRTSKKSASTDEVLDAILEALKDKSEGLGSEHLQTATKYGKSDIAKAVAVGMEQNLIRKEGDRRGTRYFSNVVSKALPEEEAPKTRASKPGSQMEIIPPPPRGNPPTVVRRKKAGKG